MTLLLKDPAATLDYSVDWGADYLVEDGLASSFWTVSPDEPGGVTIESDLVADKIATAKVGGGIAGRLYRLTNHVTTATGREDSRSIMLRLEAR